MINKEALADAMAGICSLLPLAAATYISVDGMLAMNST